MATEHDDEQLDGCDLDFSADPTPDGDMAAVVLFADVDPSDADAVAARVAEYREVFGDGA